VIEGGAESSASSPGWFGKVVMLGDFAHRRLPPVFVGTCDRWLSHCISESRAQLGSRWLDTYLTGPVWRFAWAPGVVDDRWWFGVLMPSVDAVGRYFPLVVAGSDHNPPMCTEALDGLADWYAHTSAAALATLQPGASVEAFESDLATSPRRHRSLPQPGLKAPAAGECQTHGHLSSPSNKGMALPGLPFEQARPGQSLWMVPDDGRSGAHDNRLAMVKGLPEPDQFSLMLEGRW